MNSFQHEPPDVRKGHGVSRRSISSQHGKLRLNVELLEERCLFSVSPAAPTGTEMNFVLEAQDPTTGAVLSQVQAGETINLVAYVQDTRALPYGVDAAAADVSYDPSLASIPSTANITYGADFSNGEWGSTSQPGKITDAGGFQGSVLFPSNRTPAEDPAGIYRLWSVPVTVPANAASGTLTFTPSTANNDHAVVGQNGYSSSPFSTFLYDANNEVPASLVNYVPAVVAVNGIQATPTFSIAPAQVTDSTTGPTSMTFEVSLSQPAQQSVAVTVSTADGTGADAAIAGTDYTATTQTLTFAPGTLTQTFTVPIAQAAQIENDKTFEVNLGSATTGSTIGDDSQTTGTILNGDFPALTIPNASTTTQGTADQTAVVFTATLSQPSTQTITVDYAVQNGAGSHGAKSVEDYAFTNGVLTFAPGTTSQTITVPIIGEDNVGGTQNFTLNLFSPVHVDLARASATGTIDEQSGGGVTFTPAPPPVLVVSPPVDPISISPVPNPPSTVILTQPVTSPAPVTVAPVVAPDPTDPITITSLPITPVFVQQPGFPPIDGVSVVVQPTLLPGLAPLTPTIVSSLSLVDIVIPVGGDFAAANAISGNGNALIVDSAGATAPVSAPVASPLAPVALNAEFAVPPSSQTIPPAVSPAAMAALSSAGQSNGGALVGAPSASTDASVFQSAIVAPSQSVSPAAGDNNVDSPGRTDAVDSLLADSSTNWLNG